MKIAKVHPFILSGEYLDLDYANQYRIQKIMKEEDVIEKVALELLLLRGKRLYYNPPNTNSEDVKELLLETSYLLENAIKIQQRHFYKRESIRRDHVKQALNKTSEMLKNAL